MSDNRYARELAQRWLAVRLAVAGRVDQYPEILSLRRFLSAFAVDCVIDVGANHGQYATMLRRDVGFAGAILSFEPNPETVAVLTEHVRMNDLQGRVEVIPAAVGARSGVAVLHAAGADAMW